MGAPIELALPTGDRLPARLGMFHVHEVRSVDRAAGRHGPVLRRAYAVMGGPREAIRALAEAHEGWQPRTADESAAMDRATAEIHLELGQLEAAEPLAASALRTYSQNHRRGRTMAELLLAEVHISVSPRG